MTRKVRLFLLLLECKRVTQEWYLYHSCATLWLTLFMLASLPRLVLSSPPLKSVCANGSFALALDGMWTRSKMGQVRDLGKGSV